MNQGQVSWDKGESITAVEIKFPLPYMSNLWRGKNMWFNLQLGFLHNDAFLS